MPELQELEDLLTTIDELREQVTNLIDVAVERHIKETEEEDHF